MKKDKYDEKIMDVVHNGEKVGEITRKRSAEEYAKEHWAFRKIRMAFNKMVKNNKNNFRVPIIEKKEDE